MNRLFSMGIFVIAFLITLQPWIQTFKPECKDVRDTTCTTDTECGCTDDCLDGPPWEKVESFPDTRADIRRM